MTMGLRISQDIQKIEQKVADMEFTHVSSQWIPTTLLDIQVGSGTEAGLGRTLLQMYLRYCEKRIFSRSTGTV